MAVRPGSDRRADGGDGPGRAERVSRYDRRRHRAVDPRRWTVGHPAQPALRWERSGQLAAWRRGVTLPTLKQVAIAGAFIGSAIGGYLMANGVRTETAPHSTVVQKLQEIDTKIDEVRVQVTDIKSDVRLLKCQAGFPGDCPRP